MIEDMAARKLNPHTQRSHISGYIGGSPPGSNARPIQRRPTRCAASNCTSSRCEASICNRNRIMAGVRFLFRITLRRHDLAAEILAHIQEPQETAAGIEP